MAEYAANIRLSKNGVLTDVSVYSAIADVNGTHMEIQYNYGTTGYVKIAPLNSLFPSPLHVLLKNDDVVYQVSTRASIPYGTALFSSNGVFVVPADCHSIQVTGVGGGGGGSGGATGGTSSVGTLTLIGGRGDGTGGGSLVGTGAFTYGIPAKGSWGKGGAAGTRPRPATGVGGGGENGASGANGCGGSGQCCMRYTLAVTPGSEMWVYVGKGGTGNKHEVKSDADSWWAGHGSNGFIAVEYGLPLADTLVI